MVTALVGLAMTLGAPAAQADEGRPDRVQEQVQSLDIEYDPLLSEDALIGDDEPYVVARAAGPFRCR